MRLALVSVYKLVITIVSNENNSWWIDNCRLENRVEKHALGIIKNNSKSSFTNQ